MLKFKSEQILWSQCSVKALCKKSYVKTLHKCNHYVRNAVIIKALVLVSDQYAGVEIGHTSHGAP